MPHRYPMLLVDRVLELEHGQRVVAIKNVTLNEPYFVGHYPDMPIMPGVLIVEAMAQAGALIFLNEKTVEGVVPVIASIENIRFRKQVVPGDQLRTEANVLKFKGTVGKITAKGYVGADLAAEMELTFMLIKRVG